MLLFTATEFTGELISSAEGTMYWVSKEDLSGINTVKHFHELLLVMLDDNLNEFQYVPEEHDWNMILK